MRFGGIQLSWLQRRWWVIAASVVAVCAVAMAVHQSPPADHTAEAVLIVRSGATTNTPGSANEANRLAVTYAQLIPQDTQVLDRVARSLDRQRADIEHNVAVVNDPNTSILRVQYQADDEQTAVNGARAMADALAGPNPASSNFNGVGLSRLPDSARSNSSTDTTLPVGIVLGLLLGIVLVIGWERIDGRIDDRTDLEHEVNCPVTVLEELSSSGVVALLDRWRALALDLPAQIALVSAVPGYRALTAEVAQVFAVTAAADPDSSDFGERSLRGLVLASGGSPGTAEVGEALVQHADLTVLIVPEGAPLPAVRRAIDTLGDFGVTPGWALYASTGSVRRARRNHPTGESVVVDVRDAALLVDR